MYPTTFKKYFFHFFISDLNICQSAWHIWGFLKYSIPLQTWSQPSNPQSMHRKRLCTCIQAPQWFLPLPPPQGIASPPGPQVSPGTPKMECLHLKGRVRVPKQMNFWKGSKGGGGEGVIFNPKIYNADFGPLNRGYSRNHFSWSKNYPFDRGITELVRNALFS